MEESFAATILKLRQFTCFCLYLFYYLPALTTLPIRSVLLRTPETYIYLHLFMHLSIHVDRKLGSSTTSITLVLFSL